MRIAIIGMGGVGGFYGGKLALKYAPSGEHDIIFVARGENLRAIREKGLKLITSGAELTAVPTLATDNPAEMGPIDLALFCVKSYGLEAAGRMIAGNLSETSVVIPLLNGVNIAERLRAVLPRGIVLSGLVYIGSSIVGPGEVKHAGGPGQLIFGPEDGADTEKFRPIERLLREAGIPAELSADIAIPVWTKYIFISSSAGLTAMLGKTFGQILEDLPSRDMLEGLMKEIEAVARAKGVNLPPDIVPSAIARIGTFPHATKTSFQRDYESGRTVEIDIFMEYIIRSGRELGIPTPLNEKVYNALMKRN